MAKETKYGVKSLERDFPNDDTCLDFIFENLHSRECSCGGTYKRIAGRKQYQCSKCRFQIAPTAGTIFHKSDTPLTLWFRAIQMFANAKSGLSAKQLERELEVTYKTAWRMLHLIRKALDQGGEKLKGVVESDLAVFGGRIKYRKTETRGEAMLDKSIVIGAVERGGNVRVKRVQDKTRATHQKFLQETVDAKESVLMTDAAPTFKDPGFDHFTVNHKKGEYVRGSIYVNTMDAFWSHVKRSIKGTHKVVSKKHLQAYLDGFVFHYNNRGNDRQRFSVLMGTVLLASK